jgi:hypothetical protein
MQFFLEDKISGIGVTFEGTFRAALERARDLVEFDHDFATCIVWGGLSLTQRLAEIRRDREWIDPVMLT